MERKRIELKRLFSTAAVKGSRNYLNTQKKYEILRTALYLSLSLSLFIAGYVQTKDRANLLTIVAVLGCLPASKSAVGAIMFLRFKSLGREAAAEIEKHSQGLSCLYDMVFTSYKKNFQVAHMAVCGNTICGFTEDEAFSENEFQKHIDGILKMDGHSNVSVKVFKNLPKYTERLDQMAQLESNESTTNALLATFKSVAL